MLITIIDIPTRKPTTKDVPYKAGSSLHYYLNDIDLVNKRVIVSGKVREDLNFVPRRFDSIVVAQNIKIDVGVIGAGIWSMASAAFAAFMEHPFIYGLYLLSSAYSIYSFLTMPRGMNQGNGMDQGSPTYTWEGGRTIQQVGVPVPIIYGIHKAWGNIINQYQSTDGDKCYIHLLLLICEGPIEGISDVKVNDIAIEEYQEASYETKLGSNTQTPIDGFAELHNVNDINVQLKYNEPFVYTSKINDAEALEIYFGFPQGLYQQET